MSEVIYMRPAPELSMISCLCDNRLFLVYYSEVDGQFIECTACGTQHTVPIVFDSEK